MSPVPTGREIGKPGETVALGVRENEDPADGVLVGDTGDTEGDGVFDNDDDRDGVIEALAPRENVDVGVIVDVALSHGVAETDETAPGVTLAEAAATTHERKVTDPGGPFAPSTVDLPIALPVVYELTSPVFT